MTLSKRKNKTYTQQFKEEIVALVTEQGYSDNRKIVITNAYMDLNLPTIKQRLTSAGIRLADILNKVFDEDS